MPQESTPEVEDFTSQLAAFKLEIVSAVVDALPALSTKKVVVEAELMTSNALTPAVVFAPQTESLAYGEVVPMPTLPEPSIVTRSA